MVPIGLALLSVDFPPVRRLWRRLQLFYGRRIRPIFRRRNKRGEADGDRPDRSLPDRGLTPIG